MGDASTVSDLTEADVTASDLMDALSNESAADFKEMLNKVPLDKVAKMLTTPMRKSRNLSIFTAANIAQQEDWVGV